MDHSETPLASRPPVAAAQDEQMENLPQATAPVRHYEPLEIAPGPDRATGQGQQPAENFGPNLSPSALDVSVAAKNSRTMSHRWPSFAIDIASRNANVANTPFMFADQLGAGDVNYKEINSPQSAGSPTHRTSRRAPINILKLPWQHPFRHHESNRNPYKLPRALFAALFLTTTLALCSAFDAQNHCISNETDALLALLGEQDAGPEGDEEDDAISSTEILAIEATCKQMFRQVMLPVGIVTGVGSLMALGILRQHQKSFGKATKADRAKVPLMALSPPSFYSFYLPLLFVSALILAAWTIGIILVMLAPRDNDTDNPYTSLAAVDAMGRVADNANLYYMSWISEGLAILIFYQLGGAFVRQHWHPTIAAPTTAAMTTAPIPSNPSTVSTASSSAVLLQMQVHALGSNGISNKSSMDNSLLQFPSVTAAPGAALSDSTQRYHSARKIWFQTFYKLRIRTGIWVAALLASLVVVASSAHIFHEVLIPAAQSLYDDDDYLSTDTQHYWWNVVEDSNAYGKICVILASQDSNLSEELCSRTFFSLLSGFVAGILCSTAIILHLFTRRSAAADALYLEACGGVYHELALQMVTKNHHIPLRTELLLSLVLSLWLGWNALWVSGVQGPAPRVGNLYYSSWICFLLCLRICLGCVEQYFDIDDNAENHEEQVKAHRRANKAVSRQPDHASYKAPKLSEASDEETETSTPCEQDVPTPDQQPQQGYGDGTVAFSGAKAIIEAYEKERARRLRQYFFLGAFSTVCAGSAFDAAKNQGFELTLQEKYMILAPTSVALLSAVLFLLCLSKTSYGIVSQFWAGGILSLLSFGIWLLDLVITMHSNDSWAVNGVGEIEMANLYYFSWAAIITAGLQMTSYMKEALRLKSEDYMFVVWAAIGKVSFVILGSALHIWHTISDQCEIAQYSALTFCSRTILAMVIAATGMAIGSTVVCTRVLVPARYLSMRTRAHCEAVVSIFLVLLFGVAAAMITGIGSPGQSVGDLYYSTWLAFWVSIGIFVSCYDQIKLEEIESEEMVA